MRFVARIWEMFSLEQGETNPDLPLAVAAKREAGSDKTSSKCWLP